MLDLNRRRLIQLGAASAAALAAPRSLMAAPKKGGRFRLALGHGNTVDSYDPATFDNGFVQCLFFARAGCLTEIGPDNNLRADLAESWEGSDAAKKWVINLRKGVEFHNGGEMTSQDVIDSLNHHRGEDSKSAAKPLLEDIVSLEADGPHRIVVTLVNGNADFPFVLSDYHLGIHKSNGDGTIDFASGKGTTGGYIVQEYEPGVRAFLTRNPNYWKPDAAYFDEIELLSIVDPAARMNALMTGEVDAVDQVDLKTVSRLKRVRNIDVESVAGTQHYTFAMDTRAEPFNDNNVRLALKYGVNRQELVDKILKGYGVVGNDHPIGTSNRFHAGDAFPQKEYDADKSRYYLKQAGLDSVSVDLSAADAAFGGAVDAAVLYQESAKESGININVVREPNDGYWSNVWMKKPWSAVYWGGRPTEDWMFTTAYASGAAWNDSYWENEPFNKLLVEARSELDEDKRRDMYIEMQRLVSDEGGVVIPMFASYVSAKTKGVMHHDDVAANWAMDGWKICERWWFA